MPPNDIIALAEKFRAQLIAQDAAQLARMSDAYRLVYNRLKDKIDLLVVEVGDIGLATRGQVIRLARYKDLIASIEIEMTQFSGFVNIELSATANLLISQASEHVQSYLLASGLSGNLATIQPETIRTLLGFLDPAGPLYKRLGQLASTNADAVSAAIIEAVGLGYSPIKLARTINSTLGVGLTDALRMSRTVQLWTYREATRANYAANSDIVFGWIWFAELSGACMSCVNQHGSIHKLEETLDDHFNGRCLAPGQLVVTGRGLVPIEDVARGDYVLTHKNRMKKVVSTSKRKFDGSTYTFNLGNRTLEVTPDHPILTGRGWVAAKHCNISDTFFVLNSGLVRASNRRIVQPFLDRYASLLRSFSFFWPNLCHKGSSSTSRNKSGKAKSRLYEPVDFCGIGDNPALVMATKSKRSPFDIDDSHVASRVFAKAKARFFCASGVSIREIASGFLFIWRKAASLDEIGSMSHSFIQRIMVRVLTLSSAHNSRYDASSCTYRLCSHDLIGSSSIATMSASNLFLFSSPCVAGSRFSPKALALCNTDLWVRPFSKLVISLCNIKSKLSKMILSSSFVQNLRMTTPLFDSNDYGTIIQHPLDNTRCNRARLYVYNLQVEEDESYIANGVVVHNCAMLPYTGDNPIDQSGADWFAEQPKEDQIKQMGPAKYDAWKDGKVSISDMSKTVDNDVFGEMRVETPLKDLLARE